MLVGIMGLMKLVAVTDNDYARTVERFALGERWSCENNQPSLIDQFVDYDEEGDRWHKAMWGLLSELIVARITGGTLPEVHGRDGGIDMWLRGISYQIKYNSFPRGGFYLKTGTTMRAERGIVVCAAGDHKVNIAGWVDQKWYAQHAVPTKLRPTNTVMLVDQPYLLNIDAVIYSEVRASA